MKQGKTAFWAKAAVIAALYTILTLLTNAFGLANYTVQVRISEALTILPLFTPAAIPGLFAGCLLSNIMTGCIIWDIIGGPIATLLGALGTYCLRSQKKKWVATLPPILSNTIIIPFILAYAYRFNGSLPYFMLTVGAGELLSCTVLGLVLYTCLNKYRKQIFN